MGLNCWARSRAYVVAACLAATGCPTLPALNPYDPAAPEGIRAKATVLGSAALPDQGSPSIITVEFLQDTGSRVVATVNADGTFRQELASGTWSVEAKAPLYGVARVGPLVLAPGDSRDVGLLVLAAPAPDATLNGRVETVGGIALDGVLLTLHVVGTGPDCAPPVREQPAREDGSFELGPIPSGRYVVTAEAAGSTLAVSQPVNVERGARASLEAPLQVRPILDALKLRAVGASADVVGEPVYVNTTDVELRLDNFGGMQQVRASTDAAFQSHGTPAAWVDVAPAVALVLGDQDGAATLHLQLRRRLDPSRGDGPYCLATPVYRRAVVLDRVAPVLDTVVVHNALGVVGDDRATVNVRLSGVETVGLDAVQLVLGDGDVDVAPWTAAAGFPVDTTLALPALEGAYRLRVRVRDRAGNVAPVPAREMTVARDLTDPPTPMGEVVRSDNGLAVVAGAPTLTNDPRPTLTFRPGAGMDTSTVVYAVELSAGSDFSAAIALPPPVVEGNGTLAVLVPQPLRDGRYRWRGVATDGAGRRATGVTQELTVDGLGPAAPPFISVMSPTSRPVAVGVALPLDAAQVVLEVEPVTAPGAVGGAVLTADDLDAGRAACAAYPAIPRGNVVCFTLDATAVDLTPGTATGLFLVRARALDVLGNLGLDQTETFILDLTVPSPVLLAGAPPPFSPTAQVTVQLDVALGAPHLSDPSFSGYEACSALLPANADRCGDAQEICRGDAAQQWAPVAGVDRFVVPLVALPGGAAANPATLNCVCVRARDGAGNASGKTCREVVLDQVPPAVPLPAVNQMEAEGPTARVWLTPQACRGNVNAPSLLCDENPVTCADPVVGLNPLGQRTLTCPLDSTPVFEVRGGPGRPTFTPLGTMPIEVLLEDDTNVLDGQPAVTRVDILAVDAAGNRSPATASVDVLRPSARLLSTLPPSMALRPAGAPHLAATNGTALYLVGPRNPERVDVVTGSTSGGAPTCYDAPAPRAVEQRVALLAQPAFHPSVGLDPAGPLGFGVRRDVLPELVLGEDSDPLFQVVSQPTHRMGAAGASHGVATWMEGVWGFALGNAINGCGAFWPQGRVFSQWPDDNGRFDLRRNGTPWSDVLDCDVQGAARCVSGHVAWAPEFQDAPAESVGDGRVVVVTGAGSLPTRLAAVGPPAGRVEVDGPALVAVRVAVVPRINVVVDRVDVTVEGLPAGTLVQGAFYRGEASSPTWRFTEPGISDFSAFAAVADGSNRISMTAQNGVPYASGNGFPLNVFRLQGSTSDPQDPTEFVMGLHIPTGVHASFPVHQPAAATGPFVVRGITTVTGALPVNPGPAYNTLTTLQTSGQLVYPPGISGLVLDVTAHVRDLDRAVQGSAAVDFGPNLTGDNVGRAVEDFPTNGQGGFNPASDDREVPLVATSQTVVAQPLGGAQAGLTVPQGGCGFVIRPSTNRVVRRVTVRGRGPLDLLEVQLWAANPGALTPAGAYTRVNLDRDFYQSGGDRIYLGGLGLRSSDPLVADCTTRVGGCPQVDGATAFTLEAGRLYVVTVAPEPLDDYITPHPYVWPGPNTQVFAGTSADPDMQGTLWLAGANAEVVTSQDPDQRGLTVLGVSNTAPACDVILDSAAPERFVHAAVDQGLVATVRSVGAGADARDEVYLADVVGGGPVVRLLDAGAGRHVVAAGVHRRTVRMVVVTQDGADPVLFEAVVGSWPPSPMVAPSFALDAPQDPLRVDRAFLDGERLVLLGLGGGRPEARVLRLRRDGLAPQEVLRTPVPANVEAWALDGHSLFSWRDDGNGAQLHHLSLARVAPVHPGGVLSTVGFSAVEEHAVLALGRLGSRSGTQLWLLPRGGAARVLPQDPGQALQPVALAQGRVAYLHVASNGVSTVRIQETALPVATADVLAAGQAEVAALINPARVLEGVAVAPVLAGAGDLLAVLGRQGSQDVLRVFAMPLAAGVSGTTSDLMPVLGPVNVPRPVGLQVAGNMVAVTSAMGDGVAFVLEGGTVVRRDFNAFAAVNPRRLLGVLGPSVVDGVTHPGGILQAHQPPAAVAASIPAGVDWLSPAARAPALLDVVLEDGQGVELWRGKLPAGTYLHQFSLVERDGAGNILLHDQTASPVALWRLDGIGGLPQVVAGAWRPLCSGMDAVGFGGRPSRVGDAVWCTQQRPAGVALMELLDVTP